MPVIYTTLEETQKTILRSCFLSVIKDVTFQVGIPRDCVVSLIHGMETGKTDNKANISGLSSGNVPTTVSQRRVVGIVTETYDEDSLTTTAVSQRDTYPIFLDRDIDVSVYPVYVKSQVTISLEYSCGSKTEAMRVRDDIRVRMSQGRNIMTHEVEYNVLLPLEVEDFITDVYDLKNRLFPQPLSDYFSSNATKRIVPVTDMANPGNAKLSVHERQVRIVGTLDFTDEIPAVEQDKDSNVYKITIPYKFTIDVPKGMCMSYPPMICNRLMPTKYLDFIQESKLSALKHYTKENKGYTGSLGALSHFEAHTQLSDRVQIGLPLNLPLFDDFKERVGHPGYVVVSSFLTDVDETDKRSLINLKELGEFYIDGKLLKFISETERENIVQPYVSLFYLGLHQTSKHYNNNMLEVDTELNVKSKVDLSLVKPIRVTLCMCLDTTALNPLVMERMKVNKDIYLLYLKELMRALNNYKSEFSKMNAVDNTFYRGFVLILHDAYVKDEGWFITEFMRLFSVDKMMMQRLVGKLSNSYPNLYKHILKYADVDKYKVNNNYGAGDTDIESYAMRSVMYFNRVAYLRTDQEPNPK